MNIRSIILALSVFVLCTSCVQFRDSNQKLYQYFGKTKYQPQIQQIQLNNRTIRYLEIGQDSLPLLCFVHGAPGSLSSFKDFLKDQDLLQRVKMVSVDRAGYGYSNFGKAVTSIQQQALYLKTVLENYRPKHRKIILVGSSYGGAVIARTAMDYPELVDGLMFISSSLEPEAETTYLISYPTRYIPFRYLLPRSLRVANDEKMVHKKELRKMLPHWHKIRVPCSIMHGTADGIIYVSNAFFAQAMLKNAPIRMTIVEDKKHFLPWVTPKLVKSEILTIIDWVTKHKKNKKL